MHTAPRMTPALSSTDARHEAARAAAASGATFAAIPFTRLMGLQRELAAYRGPLCATGPCLDKAWDLLGSVGFRCARPARCSNSSRS